MHKFDDFNVYRVFFIKLVKVDQVFKVIVVFETRANLLVIRWSLLVFLFMQLFQLLL